MQKWPLNSSGPAPSNHGVWRITVAGRSIEELNFIETGRLVTDNR